MEFQCHTMKSNDRTRADRKRRRWRTPRQLVTFLSRRIFLFIFYSIALVEIINLPFQIHAITPKYETAYACEGKTLTIECGRGSYINLIRANYGRFSITICNDHGNDKWSVNCMSYKSLRVLQSKCEHQQNCSVLASTSMFGDPCMGTHKYLEAHYQCVDASQHTTSSTMRPSIPPWLITSQPSVFITSTARPPRITTTSTTTTQVMDGSSQTTMVWLKDNSNMTAVPSSSSVAIIEPSTKVTSTTKAMPSTTDLAMETKTTLLFNANNKAKGSSGSSNNNNNNNYNHNNNNYSNVNNKSKQQSPTMLGEDNSSSSSSSSPVVGEQLFCGPTQARNLFWNVTRFNDLNVQPCPGGATGLAKWRCQLKFPHLRMLLKHVDFSQGVQRMRLWSIWQNFWSDFDSGSVTGIDSELDQLHWYPQAQPDLTGCYSLWLTSIEQRLKQTNLSLINLVNDLTQVTNNKQLYGGDLLLTIKIIKLVYAKISHSQEQIEDPKQREQVVYELLNGTLKIFSNLIDRRNFQMWQDLSATDRKYILTELLIHLEENSFLLAELIHRERHIVQKVQNILLSVRILDIRHMNQLQVFPDEKMDEVQWQLNEDRIEIPRPALLENNDNGLVRIVFVAFDRLERILRPAHSFIWQLKTLAVNRQSALDDADRFFDYIRNDSKTVQITSPASNLGTEQQDEDEHKAKWQQVYDEMKRSIEHKTADNVIILNSKIISASLGRGRHVELSHPVRIHFKHIQVENVTNPVCVFWNFIDHAWSEDGCRVETTNATHTTCACDHLTNFALLMVQKQTAEMQFFQYVNENNHHQNAVATVIDGEDVNEGSTKDPAANVESSVNPESQLVDLADFKRIILRNNERILSKHWDFLSQREVRELSVREQKQVLEAWQEAGVVRIGNNNVENRQAMDMVRSEFLRLKNFTRIRKILVLIKNSLFWKMKRFNNTAPLRMTRQINWRELPKTPYVHQFLKNLIKFRDFLRDGKMDNEKMQHLDLLMTERQENAFIVRFLLLNEDYQQKFLHNAQYQEIENQTVSFRALNSFYIREQMKYLQTLRQQKNEDKLFVGSPEARLLEAYRGMEKDDWFLIEDIRSDEFVENGFLDDGTDGKDDMANRSDLSGSADDNLYLFQLVRNNTTLRLFIYLSIVLCIAFIILAIVLLKVYRGSMFKVENRSFIAKNVYVCLIVFQVIFLIGMEHERRDIVCGINALLFHVIGLAIVAWLCFEGYQLHAVLSKTEDFLHPPYLAAPNALDMNYSPAVHAKRSANRTNLPLKIIYCSVTYGTIIAIVLGVCLIGGYELMYVQETDNCLCMSRIVWRVPKVPQFEDDLNDTWIPLEPRILSSTHTEQSPDLTEFAERVPVPNYYFYFTFLLPIIALFLVTLFYITTSIYKIYKKYCQYQAYGEEEQMAQMLRAAGNGMNVKGMDGRTLDNKLRPNLLQLEKERLLINDIRFYLRGSVMFLIVFSITWIFGYAFINRSPHNTLYGYLFGVFNVLEGVYILLFVCVQHDKFQSEFQKWRRRKSLIHNPYHGQSPDDDGSGQSSGRHRRLIDSLCCCLNVVFHPQHEKQLSMFDNSSHQVEIRARDDGGGFVSNFNTATRRGFNNGMGGGGIGITPMVGDPNQQYYMNDTNDGHYSADDHEHLNQHHHQQQHQMNYMNNLDGMVVGTLRTRAQPPDMDTYGFYPNQQHSHPMVDFERDDDPYNHMQNFEHVMHRKESVDRRVEDELWQGTHPQHNQFIDNRLDDAGATMLDNIRQLEANTEQFFMQQPQPQQLAHTSSTHQRSRRKKLNSYQSGSATGSSYNMHGMEGDEPIYEEILNNISTGSGVTIGGGNGGSMRHQGQHGSRHHLSAFLNEKSNAVISCLEPIK